VTEITGEASATQQHADEAMLSLPAFHRAMFRSERPALLLASRATASGIAAFRRPAGRGLFLSLL